MAKLTRRGFIKQTSVGAASLGVLAAVPSVALASHGHHGAEMALTKAELAEPMVAHVRNAATGEIAILVGTREIIIHDRAIVARLVKATR